MRNLSHRRGLHVDACGIRKIAQECFAYGARGDELIAGDNQTRPRVLGLESRGTQQLLRNGPIGGDDRKSKSGDDALLVSQRPGVYIVLGRARRDDDLACADSVFDAAGEPDCDHAPRLQNVARVLGRHRRGDLAHTRNHDHQATAFPDREAWADALRPRHPVHEHVGFLLERGNHRDRTGVGPRHRTQMVDNAANGRGATCARAVTLRGWGSGTMPWSSAPGPTVSPPPSPWPRRADRSSCWRGRRGRAGVSGPRSCWSRDSATTSARRSWPCRRWSRFSVRWAWSWSLLLRHWRTPLMTAPPSSSSVRWPRPRPASVVMRPPTGPCWSRSSAMRRRFSTWSCGLPGRPATRCCWPGSGCPAFCRRSSWLACPSGNAKRAPSWRAPRRTASSA